MFLDYLEQFFSVVEVSGGNQVKLEDGTCPFCGESRSDLRIYVNRETFVGQCFHCGRGFSSISFIAANERCSKAKAQKILEGMDDGWDFSKDEENQEDEKLIIPPSIWARDSPQAMTYLNQRSIPEEVIKHFRLIYATGNVLIKGKTYYAAGRIIIPIFNINGKMVSWQGRDISGKSKQKYLFPPGFKGRESVYNSHTIREKPDYLIICEGVFDVFGWWRAGFHNVVATFGKKLADGQLDIIRRISPKRLYIAWDSDADWLKYELVEKIGWMFEDIKIIDLNGRDADELKSVELAGAVANSTNYNWSNKILNSLSR